MSCELKIDFNNVLLPVPIHEVSSNFRPWLWRKFMWFQWLSSILWSQTWYTIYNFQTTFYISENYIDISCFSWFDSFYSYLAIEYFWNMFFFHRTEGIIMIDFLKTIPFMTISFSWKFQYGFIMSGMLYFNHGQPSWQYFFRTSNLFLGC